MSFEKPTNFEIDQLLHPANAFEHPNDVVNDPDLSLNEKRAILASWASDACAVEAAPELRQPSTGLVVRYDDIIDALQRLDKHPASRHVADAQRRARKRRFSRWRRGFGASSGGSEGAAK